MRIVFDDERGWIAVSRNSERLLREVLKEERERQGVKISALENMMGVSHPMYYNFETGYTKNTTIPFRAMEELNINLCIFGGSS